MTFIDDDDAPEGMVWVPTARGIFGDLEDWKLVPVEAAADWDVRRWKPRP
ncbi:hypothetical protein ACFWN7_01940 [Agromyces sp. NPDC058484]